ncbi:TonB-dependent receptor [Halomonas dongshanensis]|uniref:TonB-dependent hemoglobin/transferrin/lactoferrin family receptor n=1 Tax=Halomonas dongshanensis TaxID=2890835 RepID=A0ABT2E9E4_9GAMM|nr:TonB-dependent receptor [Halomonas dongshanensis]MCS2608175.1 TonB-dependent hemoglobin/transferrin/lactoferrin family receptor [Halomonas dongshanensis]
MTPPTPLRPKRLTQAIRLALCSLLLGPLPALAQGAPNATREEIPFTAYDIAPGALDQALSQFATTAGVTLSYPADYTANRASPGLSGYYTEEDALTRLLEGNDLYIVPIQGGYTLQQGSGSHAATSATVASDTALSTVTVQADRLNDDWVYYEPRSVSVISREQIDRLPPRHAADMLIETPGVYSAVNTQDPALSVNIRGMQDFGRVNMMIDGMRQNFNENAHQQRNGNMYVDSELLSEVVISKGPSSNVYGAGAIAGSANFRTLNYDDIIMDDNDVGARIRANTGLGGEGNGVNFIGSVAVAGRFADDRLGLLGARSQRSLGEYSPGSRKESFDWLLSGVQDGNDFRRDGEQVVDRVKFSDQTQDSNLFKARWNLTPDQSLQFTYLDTEISYNNVSDRRITNPADGSALDGEEAWQKRGDAQATSQSIGLEYAFNPESDLVDLNARVYRVSTDNERYTQEGRPVMVGDLNMTETAWSIGLCSSTPFPDSWREECEAGLGSNVVTSIDTYGLALENTARFSLGGVDGFRFNHGIEYFQDRGESSTAYDRRGSSITVSDNTLQPNGKRSIASAFGNLVWENDTWTLGGGLRYDYYRLQGDTRVPGVQWNYLTRQERFDQKFDEEAKQRMRDAGTYDTIFNRGLYAPGYVAEHGMYEYEVNNREDKLLPTLQAAYRPSDWLELFTSWGESWRPPALTESLMEGSHPGDPFAIMFPNPYADPETSRSWEVGFNTVFQGLLKDDDRLFSKVTYYDTRADNYLITSMANAMPGVVAGAGLGNTMFINNRLPMNFRGIELELDYDARNWYTRLNYTHVLGGDQSFCQERWPLGSHQPQFDMADEQGNYTEEHQWAIENGYDSYESFLDQQLVCATGGQATGYGMNSARNVPMDRGSWVIGTRLFNERLDMGTRLNYSAEGKPEDFTYAIWPSYVTWDLYASYRFNDHLLMRASIENLRDRNYVQGYSDIFSRTYGPGRTAMAGIELQF